MEQKQIQSLTVNELARNLATFAIDRTDVKELLQAIPGGSNINLTTVEYELQILKILSVGWGIAFYMPVTDSNKGPLTTHFWECIREISDNISQITETTTGQKIDYFKILKERLDTYLNVMQSNPDEGKNPANIMGPTFAVTCNCAEDAAASLTGTKMFTLTLGAVKEYIASVTIDDVRLN